jgi:hypothetical protein
MNYERFRSVWDEALTKAGMHIFQPTEAVDLGQVSRTYLSWPKTLIRQTNR